MTDIVVSPNGPLRISGDFVIKDGQERSSTWREEPHIALPLWVFRKANHSATEAMRERIPVRL